MPIRETADMTHKLATFILNQHKKDKKDRSKDKTKSKGKDEEKKVCSDCC